MKTYSGWLVAVAIVTLALADDPTCPSDLNNDGNVATADLLQLLSDWGPCPTPPKVIQVDAQAGLDRMLRLWSDGRIECGVPNEVGQCGVEVNPPWTEIPNEPPFPPSVRIVQVTGHSASDTLFRLWSDGTLERNELISGGCGNPDSIWCGWTVVP